MDPSTPNIGAKSTSVDVIEIIDSDDEPNITQNLQPDRLGSGNISLSTCSAAEKEEKSETNYAQNNEENSDFGEDVIFGVTPKRKRTRNVVISDDDCEGDDMHISKHKRMHSQEVSVDQLVDDDDMPISKLIRMKKVARRRLQPLRKCDRKSLDDKKSSCRSHKVKHQESIPTNDDAHDETEEDSSYSEGGNMGDFIVDGYDVSNSEGTSSKSQDGSNGEVDSDSRNLQDFEDSNKVSNSKDVSDGDMDFAEKGKNSGTNYAQNNEENLDFCEDVLFGVTPKRKRTCNVVKSESENNDDDDDYDDDDMPISKLMRMHIQEVSAGQLVNDDDMPISRLIRTKKVPRHRLHPLRKCLSKSQDDKKSSCRPHKVKNEQSIPTNVDAAADDESEEDFSYSEEGNFGFVVDDYFDVSNYKDTSSKSQDGSNGELDSDSSNLQDLEDSNKVSNSKDVSDGDIDLAEKGKNSETKYAQNNEENLDFGEDVLFSVTPKRKRTCTVVISEPEGDDDDDDNMPRHRLYPPRKCVSKKSRDDKKSACRPDKGKNEQSIPTNVDAAADDESEEDLSSSEEGNLSGFIVDDDSDVSNCKDTSSKSQDGSNGDVDADSSNSQDLEDSNKISDSQEVSDGDMKFGKILSKIQRRKNHKMKWEFEADMLAEFGKDLEICMKAVCVLYRQQTSEEQMIKGALCQNGRGFNKFDAERGSTLAEFLTDGDPHGGLKKTVEELQEYGPEAVELCRSLAFYYSKQLYEIYKNKEDPFFP